MKKLSLRIRFTLMTSFFLFISCTILTLLSDFSANKMVDTLIIQPNVTATQNQDVSESEQAAGMMPATMISQGAYEVFHIESVVTTVIIILLGSAAAYFAAGYVLKSIQLLSEEVKKRNINNFADMIPIPQSADEIQDLTVSFNHLLKELQHSFDIQKQFSADAAHELRTPLAVMQTKLDVFSLSTEMDEETSILIADLQTQLERLTTLIEDLLWFSRDLPLESVGPVQLLPLLADVADELAGLAAEKHIDVQVNGVECVVTGQDCLLERVFYNLIENAIKYSPPNTMITVSTKTDPKGIQVFITDQGEGIPEQYHEMIFEPFFRVEKSRNRKIGGSGLGLAVCKKILERHHASIDVASNTPKGSVFQIKFPS